MRKFGNTFLHFKVDKLDDGRIESLTIHFIGQKLHLLDDVDPPPTLKIEREDHIHCR